MRLVFYPAFDEAAALSDHFYRLHWFLLPFREQIQEIVLPVVSDRLVVGRPAEFLDSSIARLVGKLNVKIVPIQSNEALSQELARADCVLAWRVGDDGRPPAHPALTGKRVIRIDHAKLQHATSFYLKFPETFTDLQNRYVERSKEIFRKIQSACAGRVGYIFGTGPNLSLAKSHDFSDGVSIACNSMVRNYELLERLKPPLIVVADPIFHAGPSSYAEAFRADLVRAMDKYGSYLLVPQRDYHIYQTHMPERLRDRIAAIPFVPGDKPNLDLNASFGVTTTGNILTLFLVPLAATFFREIRIFGCDGRPMSENSYFWSHDKASQINDKMVDIQKAHPAFFAIDFDDYYLTHCRILATWLDEMERAGKVVTNHTPSFIPALVKRSTGPLIPATNTASPASNSELSGGLLISIDPEVGKNVGHYTPLNDRTGEAAVALGMDFRVYGNRETTALPEGRAYLRPHFSVNSWSFRMRDAGQSSGSYEAFRRELFAIGADLRAQKTQQPTSVFMYCGCMSAVEALLDVFGQDENVTLAVNLFFCSFLPYDEEPFVRRWKPVLERFLSNGRNRLFGTTERLADGLARAFDLHITALPHVSPTYSDEDALTKLTLEARAAKIKETPVIAFPAASKAEKGASERIEIIDAMARDPLLANCPVLVRGRTQDERYSQGSIIDFENQIPDDVYRQLVAAGDIAVLSYKPETFSDRPSGLFMDLAINGVPVVTTEGSWIADFVSRTKCGIVVSSPTGPEVCRAIRQLMANYAAYESATREAAIEWYKTNSWQKFAVDICAPRTDASRRKIAPKAGVHVAAAAKGNAGPSPSLSPGTAGVHTLQAKTLTIFPITGGRDSRTGIARVEQAPNASPAVLPLQPVKPSTVMATSPIGGQQTKPAAAISAPRDEIAGLHGVLVAQGLRRPAGLALIGLLLAAMLTVAIVVLLSGTAAWPLVLAMVGVLILGACGFYFVYRTIGMLGRLSRENAELQRQVSEITTTLAGIRSVDQQPDVRQAKENRA